MFGFDYDFNDYKTWFTLYLDSHYVLWVKLGQIIITNMSFVAFMCPIVKHVCAWASVAWPGRDEACAGRSAEGTKHGAVEHELQ